MTDETPAPGQAPPTSPGYSYSPDRKRPPDFVAQIHRQRVTVRIPGQPAINGTLTGYTQYELLITDERGRDHLVWKGPGLVLDLPEGWRRSSMPEGDGGKSPC
ncbi:MAG: hypothetical protein ABFC89_01360 [Methanospirillum sp.]